MNDGAPLREEDAARLTERRSAVLRAYAFSLAAFFLPAGRPFLAAAGASFVAGAGALDEGSGAAEGVDEEGI